MNNFCDVMRERKELIREIGVIKIGCMDEDDMVANDVIKIGVAGSGVVKNDGGNQELYSNKEREIMARVTPHIFGWVQSVSKKLGIVADISSHPECGAGAAQGFTEEELKEATEDLSSDSGILYSGHLDVITGKKDVPSDVKSWFTRRSGPHTAFNINVTIGGGITGEEKFLQEVGHKNKAFDISADWVDFALRGRASEEDIVNNLVFQFKLAYAIAEGVRKNSDPFVVFNGHRLNDSEASVNEGVVLEAVAIAKGEISKGKWKAASHH